jgi:NAD(P)-dependent dehydrogenase (short-subunit alcohol dehydrogenase family)
VVNVSSLAANWSGEIRFDDPNYELRPEEYERYSAYAKSKTANITFTKGLVKKYAKDGVESFSLSPGGMMMNS